jgi:predicted peroxiredoxin
MNLMTQRTRLALISMILLAGCNRPPANTTASTFNERSTVLFSVTSDAHERPQSVDMAMKMAGFSLDEGRQVVMFFNVQGVTIPVHEFPDDFAFQASSPIKTQITDLIKRGVDVHVCPICMKALGVEESDLIEGAKVTTRPGLFANIGPDTAVFTY